MEKVKKNKILKVVYFAAIMVLTFVLCTKFIWTHDDFTTVYGGLKEIINQVLNFGNGRYLGNFIVNIALSHTVFDHILRTIFITGFILLLYLLSKQKSFSALGVCSILTFGAGNLLLAQVFCWGHGFYNYFPPVVLALAAICILDRQNNRGKAGTGYFILVFILGFTQQLYSENTTIIALIASAFILICCVKNKKPKGLAADYFISSFLGAALMFAGPRIMGVAYKMKSYRHVGESGISGNLQRILGNSKDSLSYLINFTVLWIFLSVAVIYILKNYEIKFKPLLKLRPLLYAVFAVFPLLSCAVTVLFRLSYDAKFSRLYHISLIAASLIFIIYAICAVAVVLGVEHRADKKLITALLLLAVLSVGELLIVSKMGPRCFFVTYAILSLAVNELLLKNIKPSDKGERICGGVLGAISIVMICCLIAVYGKFDRISDERFKYANEQLSEGKTVIQIIEMPKKYDFWLWRSNESYAYAYYFNHGNKDEMKFTYIPYDEYLSVNKR